MDELLKAIEELKRAYRESGAKSVKIEFDGGDTKCVEIDNLQQTCNKLDTNLQQKPITNREWLRSLSDEEYAHQIYPAVRFSSSGRVWLRTGNRRSSDNEEEPQ